MEKQVSGKIPSSNNNDDANNIGTQNASLKTPTMATTKAANTTADPVTGNAKWDMMYHHLKQYKATHNNCLVPNRYKQMPQLGSWVSTQRRHYKLKKAGKDAPLTQQRMDLLNMIGFVWATKDPRHVPWELRFNELSNYKTKFGHCLVPVSYEENPQLANWVSTQRQEWKSYQAKRPSRLTDEKVSLLNGIGFVWEAQRGYRKRKSSERADTNGTSFVSECVAQGATHVLGQTNYLDMDEKTRRMSYKKEQDQPWIAMFKEYLWYLDQNLPPEDIPTLKQWADEQRVEYSHQRAKQGNVVKFREDESKLTFDQFKLLQSIKFDWKVDNKLDCVEKCPSAESEAIENEQTVTHRNLDKVTYANGGEINPSIGIIKGPNKTKNTEVDVAETLFYMGSKRDTGK